MNVFGSGTDENDTSSDNSVFESVPRPLKSTKSASSLKRILDWSKITGAPDDDRNSVVSGFNATSTMLSIVGVSETSFTLFQLKKFICTEFDEL